MFLFVFTVPPSTTQLLFLDLRNGEKYVILMLKPSKTSEPVVFVEG